MTVAVHGTEALSAALPDGTVVHTIPLPDGWSPREVRDVISRGDKIEAPALSWVNVLVRDGRFLEVLE